MTASLGPVGPGTGQDALRAAPGPTQETESQGFGAIWHDTLIFSQHAAARIKSRGIHLDQRQKARLSQAIDAVSNKGSQQAAIIMGTDIFVVAPQSKTVITSLAPGADGMKVITQVDAVVYVSRTSAEQTAAEEASSARQTAGTPAAAHWSLLSLSGSGPKPTSPEESRTPGT